MMLDDVKIAFSKLRLKTLFLNLVYNFAINFAYYLLISFQPVHPGLSESIVPIGPIDDFPDVARASFFIIFLHGLLAGSGQSKQRRVELLYRHKRAKTSRMTLLNILYFKRCVYFVWSPSVSLKNDARATSESSE